MGGLPTKVPLAWPLVGVICMTDEDWKDLGIAAAGGPTTRDVDGDAGCTNVSTTSAPYYKPPIVHICAAPPNMQ